MKSGHTVTLNGSAIHPTPITASPCFTWTQTTGDTVTLNDPTSATPGFTAPGVDDEKKTLTFQLVKSPTTGGSRSTDTVQIVVEKNDNDDKGCFIRTISRLAVHE